MHEMLHGIVRHCSEEQIFLKARTAAFSSKVRKFPKELLKLYSAFTMFYGLCLGVKQEDLEKTFQRF